MALREVIKLPHQNLRLKAKKVKSFDADFQKIVDDMIDTMRDEPGVGLAAPQVNVSSQLIIVEYPEDDSIEDAQPTLFVFANPQITKKSQETEMDIEGCLSVPDVFGEIERAVSVEVKGFNRFGKKQKIKAKGWLARIFQHEIDHLNGVLFVDRATQLWKREELEEQAPEIV